MKQIMHWFTGVVEDRDDPDEMGRVRVRIFGLHTDDLTKIKTNDLPWAHIMMPPTSASISGVGQSPTGLVEGSWVVGFFADGENNQDPIVMGSIHSTPKQDTKELRAFRDYSETYPKWLNDTDTSYIARDKWTEHVQYTNRTGTLTTGIEKATKPNLDTLITNSKAEVRATWDEPKPRKEMDGTYPYVHVHESESGIINEIDDTPGNSRIVQYHPSGTFYEIFSDGDKVTKISGSNFEIVINNESILVRGHQTVTIEGDARLLVKGDYTTEVTGDYNLKVQGNRNTKIIGNDSIEIVGNYSSNINLNFFERVAKNVTFLTDGEKTESIGGISKLSVVGAVDHTYLDAFSVFSNGAQQVSTNSTQRFLSKDGLEFGSENDWNLKCNANMTITVAGNLTTTVSGNLTDQVSGSLTSTSTGAMALHGSTVALN
ncbi:hypothetical protein [Lake Baikal phage Baikal-20-5m-C28]|nr:hypothetical protein [Lake Baikal phage Baikal-20-5m-C28]